MHSPPFPVVNSAMSQYAAYFDFIRFCLSDTAMPPQSISEIDWSDFIRFCKEQTITGILFHGLQKLDKSYPRPSTVEILRLYRLSEQTEQQNRQVYKDAARLTTHIYNKYGVRSCVLKGQGNALMYPTPYIRTSGDIDLWVDATPQKIIRIAREMDRNSEIGYHHIQIFTMPTPVEMHFFPSFQGNLFYEYRMRKYFTRHKEAQFTHRTMLPDNGGIICTPTDSFNRIFQMSHLMHHFFFEGIGLRQMIDYYYLLRRGFTEEERQETVRTLRHTNMYKFAAAVMYVMHELFGLEEQYLLMKPHERIGKIVEAEMIQGGNFGFYDDRYRFGGKSVYVQYFIEIYRNLHFAIDFPAETVWGRPVSRWWHMIYKAYLRRQAAKIQREQTQTDNKTTKAQGRAIMTRPLNNQTGRTVKPPSLP